MAICERCHEKAIGTIMSKFNTQTICMACKDKEKEHPSYKKAEEAEVAAVRRGVRNFPGTGKPRDL